MRLSRVHEWRGEVACSSSCSSRRLGAGGGAAPGVRHCRVGLRRIARGLGRGEARLKHLRGPDGTRNAEQEHARLEAAAKEFEGIMLELMVKEMRKNVPESPIFGRDTGREIFDEMLDSQYVKRIVDHGGIGLADMLVRQLQDKLYGSTILLARPIGAERHVGFIMNKPTQVTLGKLFPTHEPSKKVSDPVFLGGPVSPEVIFAMVQGKQSPGGRSIRILDDLYLAIDSDVVDKVIENGDEHFVRFLELLAERELEIGGAAVEIDRDRRGARRDQRPRQRRCRRPPQSARCSPAFSRRSRSSRSSSGVGSNREGSGSASALESPKSFSNRVVVA